MPDTHPLFSYSTVATAPSPATSGTSLVVAAGEGTKFAGFPFNATVWPVGAQPATANAEIVRITGVSTDTLTITRAQEGSGARTIVVGDQIAVTITPKALTDVEHEDRVYPRSGRYIGCPHAAAAPGAITATVGRCFYTPLLLPSAVSVDRIGCRCHGNVATAKLRVGVYADDGTYWPGALLFDAGQLDMATAGWVEATISQTVGPGLVWLAGATQTANPNYGGIAATAASWLPTVLGWHEHTWDNSATSVTAIVQDSVTGGLPDPAVAVWTTGLTTTQGTPPRILLRCV